MKKKLDRSRLLALIERFKGLRCTVYGDFVLDEFIFGEISRVSREAPVLILNYSHAIAVPGGGANSVSNIKALDALPFPVGIVGKDEAGSRLLSLFRKSGIDTSCVRIEKGYVTPIKTRILAGSAHTTKQQIVRMDRSGQGFQLSGASRTEIRRSLSRAASRSDGLLIADYNHGAVCPDLCRKAMSTRGARKFSVTLDSRRRILEYKGVLAATPNEEEVERALNLHIDNDERALSAGGLKLLKSIGAQALLITRGSKGMSLFETGGKITNIPVYGTDEVADVTGAGDTVISTFTLSLLAGGSFYESAVLANYAGGIVVMKRGTATISRAELIHAVENDTMNV